MQLLAFIFRFFDVAHFHSARNKKKTFFSCGRGDTLELHLIVDEVRSVREMRMK